MKKNTALPQKPTAKLMKRLVKSYLRPYLGPLMVALVFMAISAAMTAAVAQLMQPILDEVLSSEKSNMVLPVAIAALVIFSVRGVSAYFGTIINNRIGQSIVADIQKDLFAHFMRLDLSFFHANPSGQLISRVIHDVNIVRMAVSDTLAAFGKNLLTLLFLVAVMFYQDWQLSLAAFVVFPFAGGFVAYLGRRLRQISRNLQQNVGALSDKLSQIFQGIRQVQAYGMENFEQGRAAKAIEKVRDLNIKSVQVGQMSTPVNDVLVGFIMFGIIIYGGYQTQAGNMTAGELGTFLAAFILAYEPMKKLARLNNTIQTGLGAAERVFEMMDVVPVIANPQSPQRLTARDAAIEFQNVSFHYDESEQRALNHISFIAEAGKVTALVGPSGGGKTTIINLIPRFYDPAEGTVMIGDQDIRSVALNDLRAQIALVSQDITIFDDSVAANIAYGRMDATAKEIHEAARLAAADDFIRSFPEGYDTQVGEDGVKLSGGQRQRIALARAILRDAPILLLDEATSALDNESEKLVQQALEKLQRGRTTIVIAHRLSTIQNADQILVLDQGQIAESGHHDDLLNKNGVYAQMYRTGMHQSEKGHRI